MQNWMNYLQFLTRILTFQKDFIDQKRDEKDVKKVWSDISVYYTIDRADKRRRCRWHTILAFFLVCAWLSDWCGEMEDGRIRPSRTEDGLPTTHPRPARCLSNPDTLTCWKTVSAWFDRLMSDLVATYRIVRWWKSEVEIETQLQSNRWPKMPNFLEGPGDIATL